MCSRMLCFENHDSHFIDGNTIDASIDATKDDSVT